MKQSPTAGKRQGEAVAASRRPRGGAARDDRPRPRRAQAPPTAHERAHAPFSFTPKVQQRHWFLRIPTSKSGAAGACADARTTPRLLYYSSVLPQISALVRVLQCGVETPGFVQRAPGLSTGLASIPLPAHTYLSGWQSRRVPALWILHGSSVCTLSQLKPSPE